MKTTNYAYSSLDDVIFEGRNRAYGAYMLRKLYHDHLSKGLASAVILFLLFLSIPLAINKFWPEEFVVHPPVVEPLSPTFVVVDILPEKPKASSSSGPAIIEKPETTKPADEVATKIEKDSKVKDEPKPEITKPAEPAESGTAVGGSGNQTGVSKGGVPGGTGTAAIEVIAPPHEIVDIAEVHPEFPGGIDAMNRFLAKNIKYPEPARQSNLQGLVVASFVVNYEGNITDIKILKNLGGGTDAEAMRVIKMMPKWQPGKNNGRPVNVRFTLPIRFSIAD